MKDEGNVLVMEIINVSFVINPNEEILNMIEILEENFFYKKKDIQEGYIN